MLICLSSGSRPQYRDDILRCLALPVGAVIQFRYDKQYLTADVAADIESDRGVGCDALIVFVDQFDSTRQPHFIPCRMAKVKRVEQHGTSVSLELVVCDFTVAEPSESFSDWLRDELSNDIPRSTGTTVVGKYLLKTNKPAKGIAQSAELDSWEKIVHQLSARQDFQNTACFFTIREIHQGSKAVRVSDGWFQLTSGKECEIKLYHFHPSRFAEKESLQIAVSDGVGITMLTNPLLPILSRYDQRYIRFKIARTVNSQHGFLTISRNCGDERQQLFDIPIKVKGNFWLSLGYAIGLAILLAGPQIFSTWLNASISTDRAIIATAASTLCALLASVFAVFGLKKTF